MTEPATPIPLDAETKELLRMILLAARPSEPDEAPATFTILGDGRVRLRYDRTLDGESALRIFNAIRAADPDWLASDGTA